MRKLRLAAVLCKDVLAMSIAGRHYALAISIVIGLLLVALTVAAQVAAPLLVYPFA